MMIHRVRVLRVLPNLETRQVLAFRMAGTQEEAESFGHRVQTTWMRRNPGHATVIVTDWPTDEELGEHHVQPPAPDAVRFK